jgi:ubiquitin-small subunit ribosomal protein S27Ae
MAGKPATKPGGKAQKGGKEKKAPGAARSRIKLYKINGEKLERGSRFCPKCGPGIFMANHKDRYSCGSCNYMEKK